MRMEKAHRVATMVAGDILALARAGMATPPHRQQLAADDLTKKLMDVQASVTGSNN